MAVTLIHCYAVGVEEGQEDVRQGTGTVRETWDILFDRTADLPTISDGLAAYVGGSPPAGSAVFPQRGQQYQDTNCFCSQRAMNRNDKDGYRYTGIVTYTTFQFGQQQPKPADATDTTKWNIEISGEFVPYEAQAFFDKDNKPLVNTNHEYLTVNHTLYDEMISVSFYVVSPPWSDIDTCIGKPNEFEVTMTINGVSRTFAESTLMLQRVNWNGVYDPDGNLATKVVYGLAYRADTWDVKIPNASYYKNSGTSSAPKLTPWLDDNKQPKTSITYMDASGAEIAVGGEIYMLDFERTWANYTDLLTGIP